MSSIRIVRAILVLIFCIVPVLYASSASIDWGGAQNISGDADVSTLGDLVLGANIGDASVAPVTINSVQFDAFPIPVGSTHVAANGLTIGRIDAPISNALQGNSDNGSANAPFANLSSGYRALLGSGVAELNGDRRVEVSFSGLTVGAEYLVQVWTNRSSTSAISNQFVWDTGFFTPETNIAELQPNTIDAVGGLGQYVLGSFVADSVEQHIFILGSAPHFNALQLRQVTVPEPSNALLIAVLVLSYLSTTRLPFAS